MQFRTTLRSSIIGPEFYRSLPGRPASFTIKYFIFLGIALGVVFSFFFSWVTIPPLNMFMADTGKELINNFPSNLTITIKDGQASTNVSEPYSMPFPDKLRPPADSKQKAPANLLVIDTQSDSSPSKFSSYDTFILLTKDHVAYGTPDRMTVEQLKTFPDTKIDKQGLQDFANQLSEFAKWLAPIVVIASFLLYCFLFAWNFLYALFGALVVLIIGRFRKTNYRYGEAYRIALHAMTLGVLVNIILLPFAFSGGTGVLSVVAFIAVLWFNLARTAQAPTAAPPTPVA